MDSLQGHLLIAAPGLQDPNFFRTVVLLVQHNDQGALGLILNRPLEATIEEAWSQVSELPCNVEGALLQGGPCPGPLMVVHSDAELSQMEVCPGIYFNTDKESIEHLVVQSSGSLKFFVNYSGWGAGQLEGEIEAGGWVATPAGAAQVFGDDENLWNNVLRLAGRRSRLAGINPKLIPDDPSVN
ncbi:MAG TPA: YqgE/AlgH family protein [Tepidisphaeraceae bacterium]|jgi:putative transcriptional regulator